MHMPADMRGEGTLTRQQAASYPSANHFNDWSCLQVGSQDRDIVQMQISQSSGDHDEHQDRCVMYIIQSRQLHLQSFSQKSVSQSIAGQSRCCLVMANI
jgi:hypothetical protein